MKVKPFQNGQIWKWEEQKVAIVQVAGKDSEHWKQAAKAI